MTNVVRGSPGTSLSVLNAHRAQFLVCSPIGYKGRVIKFCGRLMYYCLWKRFMYTIRSCPLSITSTNPSPPPNTVLSPVTSSVRILSGCVTSYETSARSSQPHIL